MVRIIYIWTPDKIISLKIYFLLNIVWYCFKFIDRAQMGYILIDSYNIEHVSSSSNEGNDQTSKYIVTNDNNPVF